MTSYIPLSQPRQIRIIHLAPGSRKDVLCGTIETVLLGEASYEALSYEWGAPDRVCNFGLDHGSLPITTSLHQALRDLRRKAGVRTIWADGICINQDDLVERTKQVTLMGEIYRNATRVLTYIGPEADGSSSAIEFAANLVAYGVSRLRHSEPRIHIPEELPNLGLPAITSPRWQALRKVLTRTWATDPKDKIFSVLGLAVDLEALGVRVDYTQATEELYTRVAGSILSLYQDVNFLSNNLGSKKLDLPSWVPDWSSWVFGTEYVNRDWYYKAAGSTKARIRVHDRTIEVSGCLIGQITKFSSPIGPHYFKTGSSAERNQWLQEQLEFIKPLGPYPGEPDLTDALWRTLIGDLTAGEQPATAGYRAFFDAHMNSNEASSPTKEKDMARQFIDATRRKSRNRVLAAIEGGQLLLRTPTNRVLKMGWTPSFFGRRPSETDYKKWGRNISVYDEKLLMADPLSLTASIITVLGVAGATAAAVQKVQEFRNAPLDVIALGNEITDVRLLFTVIENTVELKTFKTTSIETSVGLLALLERARDLLEQIQLIHQRILPPGPVGKQNGDKPKISRRLWVKERKNVVMLLKQLRQTRQNLQTAISWMVAKAVFFEMSKNDLLGYSASWTLHIPKVLSDGDPIWRFINYGTVPQVIEILSKKQVSACDMNRDGKSLLHFAVEWERPDICKYLLTQGVSRFFQDDTGFTASMMACEKVLPPTASKERIEKQDQLRQVFQDDDLAETMDFPPLTLAILRLPEADFATHLDLNFASINVQDTLGRTPLIWATALRKPLIAQLLVDYGADTSLTDKHSKTALHWAMISQSKDVAEVLINGAANLEARDVFGRTALHEVAKVAQSADMINLLLDSGAVLDAKDARYERTPLYLATYHGRTENMPVLLDRGANIEVVGPISGHTPLLAAVAYNRSASVELLLGRGADVSAIDKDGRNILHNVARYGSAASMRAMTAVMSLTPRGCVDVELVDQKGLTAEEYFLKHRNEYYNGEISGEEEKCWAELIRVARD
ncbi:hypothetical protein ACHAPB_005890 [Verticillium nonalfalfae]